MTDPLNINIPAQGYDTTKPYVAEADYRLQITSSEVKPGSEKVGGILQWHIGLATTEPTTAVDGRDVPPNSVMYMDWPLDLAPREDSKYPEAWKASLFNAVDAIFGTTKENRPDVTTQLIQDAVGKIVLGTVKIDTDKEGTKRNKVTRLKHVA